MGIQMKQKQLAKIFMKKNLLSLVYTKIFQHCRVRRSVWREKKQAAVTADISSDQF